eukprot:4111508-Prymnesium_polylepis.1
MSFITSNGGYQTGCSLFSWFQGAAVTSDGRVVFAPKGSDFMALAEFLGGTSRCSHSFNLGVFDAWREQYDRASISLQNQVDTLRVLGGRLGGLFSGAAATHDGRVVFAPWNALQVGIYTAEMT